MALCGLSSLGQSKSIYASSSPLLSLHPLPYCRSPDKRGLDVNKAKGSDRALDTCSRPNRFSFSGSIKQGLICGREGWKKKHERFRSRPAFKPLHAFKIFLELPQKEYNLCALLLKKKKKRTADDGGFIISFDGNNRPHVNDIYVHVESMCFQRWCDSFPDRGVAMGT